MQSLSSVRIFVVDDEWVIAETLVAILNMHVFLATAFGNPDLAAWSGKLIDRLTFGIELRSNDVFIDDGETIVFFTALQNTEIFLFNLAS
jgi:hypothetical protein